MDLAEDMLKALDRVEIWKQLQGTPQRISELEKRVAELEGKIGGQVAGRCLQVLWSASSAAA
jgi:hypothetical protein